MTDISIVKTLLLQFEETEFSQKYPHRLRGEFIALTNREEDLLHNHTPDGKYLYRYPKVQYRIQKGRATLFGMQEGIEVIGRFLEKFEKLIHTLKIENTQVQIVPQPKYYHLRHWLPFNEHNWQRWQACTTLRQRLALLESILTGQLLGFCEAVGYQVPNRGLQVELLDYHELPPQHYQGSQTNGPLQLAGIDAIYQANLRLPDHIALGKGKSKGFGWQLSTVHTQLPNRVEGRVKKRNRNRRTQEKNSIF